MITREEYIKALDIVDEYHKQIFNTPTSKSLFNVVPGNHVRCNIVHANSAHCLTKDKVYEVVSLLGDSRFCIIDDNNRKKKYLLKTQQFKPV